MKIIMIDGISEYGHELKIDFVPRIRESIYFNCNVYDVEDVIYNVDDSEIYLFAQKQETEIYFEKMEQTIKKAIDKMALKNKGFQNENTNCL